MKVLKKRFGLLFVTVLLLSLLLVSCGGTGGDSGPVDVPDDEPIAGGDWRTWRGYSDEYVINEDLSILFSTLDERTGYAVYESESGARIATIKFPDDLTLDDVIMHEYIVEDYDGDGSNDVGIERNDGAIMWFLFDWDGYGTWPDDIAGCFPYLETVGGEEEPNMIIGTMYGVFSEDYILYADLGYAEGRLTPEQIAGALSEWTGLNFEISSTFDEDAGAYIIDWSAKSSLVAGPEDQTEEQLESFRFFDADSLGWFMANSLCYTIRAEIGDVDVYYSIDGDAFELPDSGFSLSPGIPFNRADHELVVAG